MNNNLLRAKRAEAAVFAREHAANGCKPDDTQTGIIDLLADLRHLCDLHSLCFGDLDSIAHGHYLAELEDSNDENLN